MSSLSLSVSFLPQVLMPDIAPTGSVAVTSEALDAFLAASETAPVLGLAALGGFVGMGFWDFSHMEEEGAGVPEGPPTDGGVSESVPLENGVAAYLGTRDTTGSELSLAPTSRYDPMAEFLVNECSWLSNPAYRKIKEAKKASSSQPIWLKALQTLRDQLLLQTAHFFVNPGDLERKKELIRQALTLYRRMNQGRICPSGSLDLNSITSKDCEQLAEIGAIYEEFNAVRNNPGQAMKPGDLEGSYGLEHEIPDIDELKVMAKALTEFMKKVCAPRPN